MNTTPKVGTRVILKEVIPIEGEGPFYDTPWDGLDPKSFLGFKATVTGVDDSDPDWVTATIKFDAQEGPAAEFCNGETEGTFLIEELEQLATTGSKTKNFKQLAQLSTDAQTLDTIIGAGSVVKNKVTGARALVMTVFIEVSAIFGPRAMVQYQTIESEPQTHISTMEAFLEAIK